MNRILLPSMKQCAAGLILKTGLLILLASTSGFASSFSVNLTNNDIGYMPLMITAFAIDTSTDPTHVYPLGYSPLYLFSIYDTGATKVYLRSVDVSDLHLSAGFSSQMNLRLNGIATIDDPPSPPFAPIFSGYQAQVTTTIDIDSNPPNLLIGGAVIEGTSALIDYTKLITKGPYPAPWWSGQSVSGIDMTFYTGSAPDPLWNGVTVGLFDDPTYGNRPFMSGVEFSNGANSVNAGNGTTGLGFLYDTGSNITILKESVAKSLGFNGIAYTTTTNLTPNWELDSITMTGLDSSGIATFTHVPVVVLADSLTYWTAGVDVVIGSNLFSDFSGTGINTKVLYDGVGDKLYINAPSETTPVIPEPSTWVLLVSGLIGVSYLARKRKGV